MRKLIFILFCFISLVTKAQVYQEMPQYGYRANRMSFDSTLQIPTTCGVPTLKSVVNVSKKAAIAFDSCNNKFYQYNPKTLSWSEIAGSTLDTTNFWNTNGTTNLKNNVTIAGDNKSISFVGGSEDIASFGVTANTIVLSSFGDTKLNGLDNSSDTTTYKPIGIGIGNQNKLVYMNNWTNGSSIDTANKWVNSVTKLNDSTLQVIKGTTTTDLTITGVSYAKKLQTQVWNNTGVTINRGSVVYISGRHSSNLPTIALAEADNEANSYKTFAIVENDILDNSQGTVIQAGNISGLNLPTSSYTDGDIVYLSPTVPGGITITKPLAPYHICKLGSVTRAHPTQGSIEVKIENGWQLDELSDVQIPAVPNDSTLLQFSRVDSLWHSVSVTNAIGTNYLKSTDTTSLSSRINAKLNASDTASLSSRINTKLNASDTSSLSSRINTKLNTTDTASLSSRINNRGYSIMAGGAAQTMTSGGTIYFGHPNRISSGTAAVGRVYIPQSGTVKTIYIVSSSATAGTNESWTMSFRLNNSSNTTIASTSAATITRVWSGTGLNIAVSAGDYFEFTSTNPTWTTAPGSTSFYATVYIQ